MLLRKPPAGPPQGSVVDSSHFLIKVPSVFDSRVDDWANGRAALEASSAEARGGFFALAPLVEIFAFFLASHVAGEAPFVGFPVAKVESREVRLWRQRTYVS